MHGMERMMASSAIDRVCKILLMTVKKINGENVAILN
jgi:hypothetical protein